MPKQAPYIGRFAPSPTGPLHLGSLAAAVGSFLDAKTHGGQWLLRIEDIDEGRCDTASVKHIEHTLIRHDLQWQGEVWVQSERHSFYEAALKRLSMLNLTYPCACTRKEIDEANALREPGENRIYPGTCRHGMPAGREARAMRFRCPTEPVQWQDHRMGHFIDDLNASSGDFVLKRGDGYWAYHLVVVVDDLQQQIGQVIRGADLLEMTTRQQALCVLLGQAAPDYGHLPLAVTAPGQKLSKQNHAADIRQQPAAISMSAALTLLGHPPPPSLRGAGCQELLSWALQHWQLAQVPKQREVPINPTATS